MMNWKRPAALVLSLALMLTMSACGSDGQTDSGNTNVSASGSVQQTVQTGEPAAEEYVYTSRFNEIMKSKNGYYPVAYTDHGVYCTSNEKVGQRELEEGETLEYEGQLDIYRNFLYLIGYDGSIKKLEKYDANMTVPTGCPNSDASDPTLSLRSIMVSSEGNLIAQASAYESWSEAPKGTQKYSDEWYQYLKYVEQHFVMVMDPDGELISLEKIQYDAPSMDTYGIALLDDNHLFAVIDDGCLIIALDGSVQESEVSYDGWIEGVVALPDHRIALKNYGDTGYNILIINPENMSVEKTITLPFGVRDIFSGDSNYDFYYDQNSNLWGYNISEEKSEKLFNWISIDVDPNDADSFHTTEDGQLIVFSNEWDSSYEECTVAFITVEKVPKSTIADRTTLIYATEYLNYDIQKAIVQFNRTNEKARIEVVTYSDYNTEEDWSAGRTKLLTEIMAGKMPDILDLNGLPTAQIAAKGLLVDLYEYLDKDPELSRDDFFASVLNAASTNGKLYQTVPGFCINTLVGAKSVVGDRYGWTYNDVYDALASLPEGAEVLNSYVTQGDILNYCLAVELNRLVDWSTGQCKFTSKEFTDMLEFAKTFKSTFDWESYEWDENDNAETRIQQGRQLVMTASVWDCTDLMLYGAYFGGEENVSYIGFPTSDGSCGSSFALENGIGISSKCANKDAAWEFVRTLFTEEYQTSTHRLPSNKKAMDTLLKTYQEPHYVKDADGNKLLDENGEYLMTPVMTIGMQGGKSFDLYYLKQESADQLLRLIDNVTLTQNYDDSITGIVMEQSAAFFAGQKSAEDVAKQIQSKATIYINEQM